jgi:hypothetical protein
MSKRVVGSLALLTITFACSSGPAAGDEGGACFPNATCNTGLTCLSNLCVKVPSDAGADANVPDVSSDAPSDVVAQDVLADAAPQWSPNQLSNLAFWLDDTTGIVTSGSAVARWRDQAVNKNDVTGEVDAGLAPTLTKAAVNGHDVVTFATGVGLSNSSLVGSAFDIQSDFAVFVVARINSSGGELVAHLGETTPYNATGWYLTLSPSNATFAYASNGLTAGTTFSSPSGSYADGKFHIIEARRTSNQITVAVDGSASTPASFMISLIVVAAPLYVGGDPANGLLAGDIAEEILVNSTLSNPDEAKIVAYLKSKFAL